MTHLEHEERGGWLVVRVSGELDLSGADAFRREVDGLVERTGLRRVLLNLRRVTFVDSTGLGAILGRLRRLQAVGGSLRLVLPAAPTRALLAAAGLDRVLAVYRSEEEALVG